MLLFLFESDKCKCSIFPYLKIKWRRDWKWGVKTIVEKGWSGVIVQKWG